MHWSQAKQEASCLLNVSCRAKNQLEIGDKIKVTIKIEDADGIKDLPIDGLQRANVDDRSDANFGSFEYKKPGHNVEKLKVWVETELVKMQRAKPA